VLASFAIDGEKPENGRGSTTSSAPVPSVAPLPRLYVRGEDLGRAMLQATVEGTRGRVIENREIRDLADAHSVIPSPSALSPRLRSEEHPTLSGGCRYRTNVVRFPSPSERLMLKISRLTDYGLLASVYLARQRGETVAAREIAEFYHLPLRR